MTAQAVVDILLSTHNSGEFLVPQLESLAAQDFTAWRLIARDDGSSDASARELRRFAQDRPGQVRLLDDAGQLGPVGSYARLLEASEAPWVMFCDHDDVWASDKVSRTLERMHSAQAAMPPGTPVMAFTDLRVVDRSLREICPSYWTWQRLSPRRTALRQLLTQNVPSACTMMLNRPLVDRVLPIPPQAVMHDAWVALVAAAMGRMVYVDRATVLYRQHGRNVIGASGGSARALARRARAGRGAMRERYMENVRQAQAFARRYAPDLPARERRRLEAFAALEDAGFLQRRWTLLRHGIFKAGLLRNLATLAIV